MKIVVDSELKEIVRALEAQSIPPAQWAVRESDDEFQSQHYCGGYDADEAAFCFSHFSSNGAEYWFQFTLEEARQINAGALSELAARLAE